MSDLHDLCRFSRRPINDTYVDELKHYLKNGIPSTYTVEEAYNFINEIEDEPTTTTTPLHLICTNIPLDSTDEEISIAEKMIEMLLEYGAGWCLTDLNNDTPGCILIKRKLHHLPLYSQIVSAGVRAELLLRKVSEYDVEMILDEEDLEEIQKAQLESVQEESEPVQRESQQEPQEAHEQSDQQQKPHEPLLPNVVRPEDDSLDAPSQNQESYLLTKLEYRDNALITKDRKDGVMMSWETDLMKLGCDSLFKGTEIEPNEKDPQVNILNIGFGMGIIDTMIQNNTPTKHYVCEAHPDVLAKLRQDGWYEKENVVILDGRWQEQLDKILSEGEVFFNGIYYDTFSEHYTDMLELFDYVVGLLKPHGVFSFFNGLGADRQVVYDVYKQLVEIDLGNYGLKCTFEDIEVPETTLTEEGESVWDDVKRSYWSCPVYYHPEARFMDF